jgi:hypothetical protein
MKEGDFDVVPSVSPTTLLQFGLSLLLVPSIQSQTVMSSFPKYISAAEAQAIDADMMGDEGGFAIEQVRPSLPFPSPSTPLPFPLQSKHLPRRAEPYTVLRFTLERPRSRPLTNLPHTAHRTSRPLPRSIPLQDPPPRTSPCRWDSRERARTRVLWSWWTRWGRMYRRSTPLYVPPSLPRLYVTDD